MKSRSEQQMMQLILDVAKGDERVRAVLLNGSRSNPNVAKDIFQDYDIIYVVSSLEPFLNDHSWIDIFGERMILQMPEDMELYPPSEELKGAFSYLMQFLDGTRIDLILVPVEKLDSFLEDSLCKLLLDKDHQDTLSHLSPASDQSYWITKPSNRAFDDCCNEFWYTNAGLAKSIWREQLPYAGQLFSNVIRETLIQMLDWYIGCRYDFAVNPGKWGKFYRQFLEPDLYERFLETCRSIGPAELWQALFLSIDLFNQIADAVAENLGFTYSRKEPENITAYLRHVQQLPKHAEMIYPG